MRTIVLAGNFRQFHQWCRENGVHPYGGDVIYASSAVRLRGLSGPLQVMRVGTWYEHQDAAEIDREIAYLEAQAGHAL